jgi:hypothetical protein
VFGEKRTTEPAGGLTQRREAAKDRQEGENGDYTSLGDVLRKHQSPLIDPDER